ncbi:hypothetical protein Adt_32192 [Abeliophyllum distichum]|uniref:Transmembrane protein n=1 Tax=Abeliophyllum distichum TaxID=126358 RepID=A0ABD1RHG1_9LAMI
MRPPPIDHRTTTQILKRTTTIFYSQLGAFLVLSFLLLLSRNTVEEFYNALITDNDPSIESLLSRISISIRIHQHRRFGNPYDDFLSDDSHFRQFFKTPVQNNAILSRNSGLPDGFSSIIENLFNNTSMEEDEVNKFVGTSLDGPDHTVIDLDILVKGFKMSWHDLNLLKNLLVNLCYAYALVLSFVVLFSSLVLRVVVLQVSNHLLGNRRSLVRSIWDGASNGLQNILLISLMKWLVRHVLALLIAFLSTRQKIQNIYMVLIVFIRAIFVPFVNLAPWVQDPEYVNLVFIVIWFVIDLIVGYIFSVGSWVVLFEGTTDILEIMKESGNIFLKLIYPAFIIRILEAIICGSLGRWVLSWVFGGFYSLGFQCLMEVYFMVAWLVYYCSARDRFGRRVGKRQLKAILASVN